MGENAVPHKCGKNFAETDQLKNLQKFLIISAMKGFLKK